MREEILRRHRGLLRRAARVRAWDTFLETAFLLTTPAAVLLLVDRLAFELGIMGAYLSRADVIPVIFGVALALSAGLAGVRWLIGGLEPAAVAWAVDRSLATDGLFLSGVEIAVSGTKGGFEDLVLRDAAEASRRIEPHRVVPTPPVRYRWAVALALAAGAALLLLPAKIAPAPHAEFDVEPVRGNAPLTVRFEETSIGYIHTYEWEFGDGGKARGRVMRHTYEKPGRYIVRLTVTGPGGTDTILREAVKVVPREYVVADFIAMPEKGRAPLEVTFRNLSSNADRFQWSFGDGAVSGEREPVHVFRKPGEYTVALEAEGGGSKDRIERTVKVVGPDAPLAEFAAHPTRGPAPLAVHFESRSTGKITSHEWDFGDPIGDPSSEADPTHVYKIPGTYTVKLKVKGPGGEDVEVKEFYIRVEDPGGGGGGGGKNDKTSGGAGNEVNPLLGKPNPRPKIKPIEYTVKASGKGPYVKKDKTVYTVGKDGTGSEKPFDQVYSRYRKAAEEAMSREAIPRPVRKYLRKYFEGLRHR